MVDLTVVIPLYNGFDNLEPLLNDLLLKLDSLKLECEILFIDDFSTDGGFDYLKMRNKEDSRIKCIRLRENRGQQNAVFCGLVNSNGKYVITMDDDGQHPIDEIPKLIGKIEEGYDIVYDVNRSLDRPGILSLGTWFNGLFFTLFLKKPHNIEIGSYRIFSRELIQSFKHIDNKFIYVSALIFSVKPTPKVFSFRYNPVINSGNIGSRINLLSRMKLFNNLLKNYGPFSFITKEKGEAFTIKEFI